MPTDSLAALLAVNQKHRRQIHEHVRHIAVPDQEHIQTLVNGTWPSLVTWHLSQSVRLHPYAWAPHYYSPTRYSVINTSDAAVSLLIKGYAPDMQHVTLQEGSISPAGIAQLHHAGWNRLQSCCLRSVKLSFAAIQALCRCADTWLFLERLDLSHNQLDAAAMSHLRAASWPCLQELDLSCTGLSQEAFQQLCLLSRSSKHSGSCGCSSMCCSSRCWPGHNTGWTCHLKRLNLSHNSLTASATEQLTKMSWPCLEGLFLQHTSMNVDAMTHLACGRWQSLLLLDISGLAVAAPALQVLLKAPWRQGLRCSFTVNLRDGAVFKQLLAIRENRLGLSRSKLQAVSWKSKICLHKVNIWPGKGRASSRHLMHDIVLQSECSKLSTYEMIRLIGNC